MSLSIVRTLIPSIRAASTLLKARASVTRSGTGSFLSIVIPLLFESDIASYFASARLRSLMFAEQVCLPRCIVDMTSLTCGRKLHGIQDLMRSFQQRGHVGQL